MRRFLYKLSTCWLLWILCWIPTNVGAWDHSPECTLYIPYENRHTFDSVGFAEYSPKPFRDPWIPWTQPISRQQARSSMGRVKELIEAKQFGDALLELQVVEHVYPLISDYIALMRAQILMRMHEPKLACQYYREASKSINNDIAIRGKLGSVRCQLEARSRFAEGLYHQLRRRFVNLPDLPDLQYELAKTREKFKNVFGAIRLYKAIDIDYPGEIAAQKARRELKRLREEGRVIRQYTWEERVTRAENLFQMGPLDQAHKVVQQLLHERHLPPQQLARVHILAARMAKSKGRWDIAKNEAIRARNQGTPFSESAALIPPPAPLQNKDSDEIAKIKRLGSLKIRQIKAGRPMRRLRNMQLIKILYLAIEYELGDIADEVLDAMVVRKKLSGRQRFNAATKATGIASDQKVADLLSKIIDIPRYRASARYYYARTLERLKQYQKADEEYKLVIRKDRSENHYYAMWAKLRRWAIKSELSLSCAPDAVPTTKSVATEDSNNVPSQPTAKQSMWQKLASGSVDQGRGKVETILVGSQYQESHRATLTTPKLTKKLLMQKLELLIDEYGAVYPWMERALNFIDLNQLRAAADEMHEIYLAWRDARGSARLRTGLITIFTGKAPPRRFANFATRKARRSLSKSAQMALSDIANVIGEPGVASRFNTQLIAQRPRAYSREVQRVAEKYGLDPNLLFAVMRVESIYNRRIVSHAGAVGLMQIMPRTGQLIARQLGVKGFKTTLLCIPEISLEFAAWYLSSLLQRFDKRLPLAIAAYNGGPHNVRKWIRRTGNKMPLEIFLEHIPIAETRRYVRRVLTHCAAYRAQKGLPMVRLDTTLPQLEVDPIGF